MVNYEIVSGSNMVSLFLSFYFDFWRILFKCMPVSSTIAQSSKVGLYVRPCAFPISSVKLDNFQDLNCKIGYQNCEKTSDTDQRYLLPFFINIQGDS